MILISALDGGPFHLILKGRLLNMHIDLEKAANKNHSADISTKESCMTLRLWLN